MNDIAITQGDLSTALQSVAMLADIHVSMWGGERTDHKLTQQVTTAAGATGNVGRTIKNLMSGADGGLKEARAAFSAAKTKHYALTLPFVSDPTADRQRGSRLLPTMLFEDYMKAMSVCRREAMAALDKFLVDYPADAQKAMVNLGGLAQPTDYPAAEELRRLFRVELDFQPIPTGAGFAGLPPAMLNALSAKLAKNHAIAVQSAQTAMWDEIATRTRYLLERLSNPEAKFKSNTVNNVSELAKLVPGWNVMNDARAAEIAADIDAALGSVKPKDLMGDGGMRAKAADQMKAVIDKLTAWNL